MELVLVPLRGGAALEVGDVGVVLSDDQGALKLSRIQCIDPEVRAQLHGAADALGDVDKGAVAEDSRIEGGEEIIRRGNDRPEVLPHQVGMLPHGLADGAEDHSLLRQLLAEGSADRDRVHDRIDGIAGKDLPLHDRDAKLLEGLFELGVHRLIGRLLLLRSSKVNDVLEVYLRELDVPPSRYFHPRPSTEGPETKVQQPVRLVAHLRDGAHNILIDPLRQVLRLDVGGEAVLVLVSLV